MIYFTRERYTYSSDVINNGNWTEWSAILSEIIRVISKLKARWRWLCCFSVPVSLAGKKMRFRAKNGAIWEQLTLQRVNQIARIANDFKAIYVQTIPNSFCACTKTVNQIRLLFTHKKGDFCAISVTERSCSAPISKVEEDYRIAFRVGTNSYPV